MALCDLSRLDRISESDARAFKARLAEAGVTREALHPITQLCERLPDTFRSPIRRWHLRRIAPPLGTLMRVFFFGDPVEPTELTEALGGVGLIAKFMEAGLLVEQAGGLVCPLRLNLVNDLWIFTDELTQGDEAVMGAGATTASLIQAAWPTARVGSVLDMGCGAGTAALLMAQRAERTVGVDISERALVLSRFNALLAGEGRTRFVKSDLFSAVAEERFDVIVSQPPFVACPSETASVTFLHGGTRGDELALELIRQAPAQLTETGRAVILVDWPKYDDVLPTQRIRSIVGDEVACDLLVLLGTPKSLDEHVTYYGVMLAGTLGDQFESYVLTHREHLERLGIRELRLALVVLRRTRQKPWTHLIETRPMMDAEPTGAQIDRILAVQDLLRQGSEALLRATLSVPPDTRFAEQDQKSVRIELPESRLLAPIVTSRAGADLLVEVGRAPTVAHAIEAICARTPQLGAAGPERVLAGVRGALQSGLLEIRDPAD